MRPNSNSCNSSSGGGGGGVIPTPRSPVSYTHSPYRTSLLAVDGSAAGSDPSSPLSPYSAASHEGPVPGSGRGAVHGAYQLSHAANGAGNTPADGSASAEPQMSSPIQVAASHGYGRQRQMARSPTMSGSAGQYPQRGSPGHAPSSPMSMPPRSPGSHLPDAGSHSYSASNNPYRVNMYGSSAPSGVPQAFQQHPQQQQQQRTSPLGTPMQHRQNSGSSFTGQRPLSGTGTPNPAYHHFSPSPPSIPPGPAANSYAPAGFGGPVPPSHQQQQGSGNFGAPQGVNSANLSRCGSYDRRNGGGGSLPHSPLLAGGQGSGSATRRDPYNMSGNSPFNRSGGPLPAQQQQQRAPRSPGSYNSGQGFLHHQHQQASGAMALNSPTRLGGSGNDSQSLASSLQTGRSFSTALDDTADMSSAQSCSSASSVRDDLLLCPNDEACAQINERKHQRKYAHTCRLFPCYHGHIRRHAKLFRHTPGQIALPEGVSATKMSTHALASVNFSSISPEAPNAYRIYVSRGEKSYEIFGDWASTKVHTFKRYLHQVYHIAPQNQVLIILRTNKPMDDEIMSVRSYGIEEDSVIQLKSDHEVAPSRIPLDDL